MIEPIPGQLWRPIKDIPGTPTPWVKVIEIQDHTLREDRIAKRVVVFVPLIGESKGTALHIDHQLFLEQFRRINSTVALQNLLKALAEPIEDDDDWDEFEKMTPEEVDARLRAEGIDPDELSRKLDIRLAEIKAKYGIGPGGIHTEENKS